MRRPQFSLITLAGIVSFCAIGCSALIYASPTWAGVLTTTAIAFLMFAATASVYRQGRARAFWLGVSIWGWLYLLLSAWLFSGRYQADSLGQSHLPELATTQLSGWVYNHVFVRLRPPPPAAPGAGGSFMIGTGIGSDSGLSGTIVLPSGTMPGMGGGGGGPSSTNYYPDQDTFVRVAQALWLWLFALAGGVAGRWLYHRPAGD